MFYNDIGLHVPEILFPNPSVNLQTWSVIACDQYTSQPEYWNSVATQVGDKPSTLHMILPEAFLESGDEVQRIENINRRMREYVSSGVLAPHKQGFVLVDRKTPYAESRKGLVVALDLERYNYAQGAQTLIRATEDTIVGRLGPRIRIRRNASLELPHIMVLIDDPDNTVIEPLFDHDLDMLYNFDLMMNGGHLRGYHIVDSVLIRSIVRQLGALANIDLQQKRYGAGLSMPLLYAMGDGNHSFATAKALWELVKQHTSDKASLTQHPARFALVELVNLHDPGLRFEPIHRVIFNSTIGQVIQDMKKFFGSDSFSYSKTSTTADVDEQKSTEHCHKIPILHADGAGEIVITKPRFSLAVESLQAFINAFCAGNKQATVDYIHGADVVAALAVKPDTTGFLLPPLEKRHLFPSVIRNGTLPRKAFSMGEADEKRFYLESRRIL